MRSRLKFTAALFATSLLVAGCGDAPAKKTKATDQYATGVELAKDYDPNGHFSYAYTAFASSWDPVDSINGADIAFWRPVYDTLLSQTPDGDIEPQLATSFKAADDLSSLTLTLREGLTFADGTPFDANAVKFNLDRYRAKESKIAGEVYQITSIDVVDPRTVKINVSGGLGPLSVALAARAGVMVSPTAAQAGTLKTAPVGIGGYRVTSQVPGDQVNYEKVANYWDPDAQKVATLTYKLISDDQTRYNALAAGELDAAQINPDQLDDAEKAGLKVIAKPSAIFLYVALNTQTPGLGDPEVRKALNMAIDRKAIAEGMYDGHCTPQIQPFSVDSPGYSKKVGDGLDDFPYDPEAAKKILKDKGIKDLELVNATPNVTIYTKFAEVVQSQFEDIGIKVSVKPLPPAQMVQEFSLDKSAQIVSSVFTGLNDPDALNGRYLAPKALFNPGGADNPEILKYATEGASFLDPAKRNAAYEKMMDAWVKTPPHIIPVCMIHLSTAMQKDVSNIYHKSSGSPDLRGVAVGKD
ncbi:ABC transporter substrate-binding protein [Cumulibacter manganitolerans]|uniref:ABC transporter substrate-binding protein n=1 Tax=Cumulibacter manganitolerans TaxID=1884992 RepID=UPI001294BB7A|nr:ABC transporter substrate-binding protein [Cumulibacter manganitolerans]